MYFPPHLNIFSLFSLFKNHNSFSCLFLVIVDLKFIQQTLTREAFVRQVEGFGAEDP